MATQDRRFFTGKNTEVWATAETTYGALSVPSSSDAIRGLTVNLSLEQERLEKADYPNEVYHGEVEGQSYVTGDIECYLEGSGTAGNTPAYSVLLESTFCEASTTAATTVNDGSAAAGSFDVADGSSFAIGDGAGLVISGIFYLRTVTAVSSNTLTFATAFPSAPANSATVYRVSSYMPSRENTNSFTLLVGNRQDTANNYYSATYYTGCVCTGCDISFESGSEAKIKFKIEGKQRIHALPVALNEGVDDSETEIDVVNVHRAGSGCSEAALMAIYQVDDEKVQITAIDEENETITVTRGYDSTTPAAHSSGALLYPVLPDISGYSEPISGVLGEIKTPDEDSIYVESANITYDNGRSVVRGEYGSRFPVGFATPRRRSGTVELSGKHSINYAAPDGSLHLIDLGLIAQNLESKGALIQGGTVANQVAGVYCQNLQWQPAQIPHGGDEFEKVTVTGKMKAASDSPNPTTPSEIYVHFA